VQARRRSTTSRRWVSRGDRGAAILEFALVVPFFIILVMGIIDFSNAYNDYNSVRQGVREGTRQIVVADWSTDGCTSGTSAAKAACVTKARVGLTDADTRVKIVLPTTYAPGEQVKVCVMYPFRSMTGFFNAVLNGAAKSELTMRIEQIDASQPIAGYEETPLPGQNWSWC